MNPEDPILPPNEDEVADLLGEDALEEPEPVVAAETVSAEAAPHPRSARTTSRNRSRSSWPRP